MSLDYLHEHQDENKQWVKLMFNETKCNVFNKYLTL